MPPRRSRSLAPALLLALAMAWGCTSEGGFSDDVDHMGIGIIGGTETQDWPSIGAFYMHDYGAMCTATLVDPSVILLAAHCVDFPSSNMVFMVGYDINMMSGENSYPLTECISSTSGFDTAICLLAEPLTTEEPMPINLTPFDETWDEMWFHYVGFGSDSYYQGPGSGTKRETDIQMFQWDAAEYWHHTEGTNTCSGDSGGPSLVEFDGEYYVAGVNSAVTSDGGGDPCSGYGIEERVDTEVDFFLNYFDPAEYQPDDDDDDAADDDDNGDDDDNVHLPGGDESNPFSFAPPGGWEGDGDCSCSASGTGRAHWALALLLSGDLDPQTTLSAA